MGSSEPGIKGYSEAGVLFDEVDLDLTTRHPATREVLGWLGWTHLPERLQPFSKPFWELAAHITALVDDGPELTTCLRKILEAKDCAVRQGIKTLTGRAEPVGAKEV